MTTVNKYRLRCTTDNKYEHVWAEDSDPVPTLCPVDSGHTVDQNQTAVVAHVISDGEADSDGVRFSRPQPQSLGHELCERDYKLTTCKVTQADAVEDLLMNTLTLREEAWAGPELSLVGVYKDDGTDMVPCVDQADADVNGILSVWDYKAIDQADGTTEIVYDVRSGALVADPTITVADRFNHRAYIVAAPALGQQYHVRLFDGYIAGRPIEGELSTESPRAKPLNPSIAPGANVIRIYVKHPAGQSHAHILWLMTYRPVGTS